MIFTPANRVFCIMERGCHRHRSGRGGGTCSFRISFFCCVSEIARLSIIIPTVSSLARSRSRSRSRSFSLSFSLFALSFKRGGYQSLLSTQETLSVDDRRCEEEVLFSYAKEGAGPISKMPNAKCQMPNNGSKQKKTKKEIANTKTQKTKQKQKQKQPIPRGARNETNER